VKENYTGAFEFPVGHAPGDYTPATVSPATANTINVNVDNYAGSSANEAGIVGIDRTWNIYGNTTASATITLQHNTATDMPGFLPTANYITRYGTAPNNTGYSLSVNAWQVNQSGASVPGTIAGSELRAYFVMLWPHRPRPMRLSTQKRQTAAKV
jgi:hypothetical protein